MIRQYLPQTNENATVAKSKIFSRLNNADLFFSDFETKTRMHFSMVLALMSCMQMVVPLLVASRQDSSVTPF
jgi:hypothetical protein